jgi:hypothetical protein
MVAGSTSGSVRRSEQPVNTCAPRATPRVPERCQLPPVWAPVPRSCAGSPEQMPGSPTGNEPVGRAKKLGVPPARVLASLRLRGNLRIACPPQIAIAHHAVAGIRLGSATMEPPNLQEVPERLGDPLRSGGPVTESG